MKRFVCILSLLLLLLLAGCVNPDNGQSSASESENESESELPPFAPEDDGVPMGASVEVFGYELIPSGDALSLLDGTLVLPSGKDSYASFTVDAPTEGIYKVDMKYNTCNGYIQYVYLYNDSYTDWAACRAETRFGDYATANPTTAKTDEDYCVSDAVRDADFDGIPETYVYLLKGENNLRLCITTNVSGNKLGVDSICFSLARKTRSTTVAASVEKIVSPSEGFANKLVDDSSVSSYDAQNGWFFRGGCTVYFDVTVPEDGAYDFSILGCASNLNYTLSSESASFLPISDSSQGLLPHSHSTMPLSLGTLNLKKGTHTVRLETSGSYLHVAMLLFDKVGHYNSDAVYQIAGSAANTIDPDSGVYRIGYRVVGVSPTTGEVSLTESLSVVGKDAAGDFSENLTFTRDAYETAHVFTGAEREGLQYMSILYRIYDGDRLLYEGDPIEYKKDQLRVLLLSDTHFAGSNVNQKIHSEKYNITKEGVLKYHAGDWSQCENYGLDSDRKHQAIMDDIIRQYKAGEIDMVFFLGDTANNESNYDNYLEQHKNYYKNPMGSIDEFWESAANYSYFVKKAYLDQLSANGIPYYMANGNHDYVYEYNRAENDIDYTAWEQMYHYAELFGHRSEIPNGEYLRDPETDEYIYYEDSDSVHYLVRVIRRDGEIMILSALSSEALAAFKEKHANDGNCYDFYVSEDTLTDSDELLGAFVMVNGFQFETYDYYVKTHIVGSNFTGQTIRYVKLRNELVHKMCENTADFANAYLLGHLVQNADARTFVKPYDNIQAVLMGDAHVETRDHVYGGVNAYVDGHNVTAFHYDKYYNADGSLDEQYYSSRSNPQYGANAWSDFLRHPNGYMTLTVSGSFTTLSRVKYASFYENGIMTVTGGQLNCNEIRYTRATADAAVYEPEEVLYAVQENGRSRLYRLSELLNAGYTADGEGVRRVYVGNDVSYIGEDYRYLTADYTLGGYNAPAYRLELATGKVYNLGGAYVGEAVSLSGSFASEGLRVTVNGATYYLAGMVGEVWGHHLYDEKGDYVFVDNDGNLVFYEAVVKGENYVEASVQEQFTSYGMFAGPFERNWYYRAKDGSYVSLDLDNDGILDDGSYTDLYISTGTDMNAVGGVYEPEIVIENGKIVKGEGWCRYGYKAVYTYADGTVVDKSELSIDYDENGNIVYGVYIPTLTFAEETLVRIAP